MKPVGAWPVGSANKPPPGNPGPPINLSLAPTAVERATARRRTENFRLGTAPSSWRKPGTNARTVAGSFSPNRPNQRLNSRRYSPMAFRIAVVAATVTRSFEEAAKLLEITAELTISPRHLQTLCQEAGGELVAEQKHETDAYQARPLMTPPKQASPPVPLATVMVDGGRIQTRQPDQGPGVHQAAWRETKTAVLLRMTHTRSAVDPRPELPDCFTRPVGATRETPSPQAPTSAKAQNADGIPETLVRSGLATLNDSERFGWMTAAAAEERGFFTAAAKAYVCDGLAYNWSIHRRHFPMFEAILDFVHASEHVHDAAKAAGEAEVLGPRWAELCWQGRVQEVMAEIEVRRSRLAPPPDPDAEPEHPWCVLGREWGYLDNNQKRMDYPRYRRDGLPITSSPIESWVKQLNQRVKGSDKFWNDDQNAEAMLHLRAAWLSDNDPLNRHLENRPGHPYARPRNRPNSSMAA